MSNIIKSIIRIPGHALIVFIIKLKCYIICHNIDSTYNSKLLTTYSNSLIAAPFSLFSSTFGISIIPYLSLFCKSEKSR